jgi:hypothetical protein
VNTTNPDEKIRIREDVIVGSLMMLSPQYPGGPMIASSSSVFSISGSHSSGYEDKTLHR